MFSNKSKKENLAEGFKLFLHDSSYSLIDQSGKSIFAISLERITRIKHDPGSILQFFNPAKNKNLNHTFSYKGYNKKYFKSYFFCHLFSERICKYIPNFFFEKNTLSVKKKFFLTFFRQIKKLFSKELILALFLLEERIFHVGSFLFKNRIKWYNHHYCHALPAFCFSPFFGDEALIFILDGLGENQYSSLWLGRNNSVNKISESNTNSFSDGCFFSIGYLYGLFTEALGYRIDSDEGKTEALAAYGSPDESLYNLCRSSHILNAQELCWCPNYELSNTLYNREFLRSQMNIIGRENFAATVQKFLEDIVVDYLNCVYDRYQIDKICLAGGVMANVILNLHIYERTPFKNIYVLPCMGDDGTSLGPAIQQLIDNNSDISWLNTKVMPYWGPDYSRLKVLDTLMKNAEFIVWEDCINTWPQDAARIIASGGIISVFQGKMEFGPRALGNRSILADPRDPFVREKMNLSIKRRPYFQPFCPSILELDREELFQSSFPNKHMTMAFRLKEKYRSILPSACHIDGTARPQFVEETDNPNYYHLLLEMKKITGFGVVINTSFNLHGRAMVMDPDQAIRDFLDCNLDFLFIEGFKVSRK